MKELSDRALEIRKLFEEVEKMWSQRSWTREELVLGMATDFGDLAKLVLAKEGVREVADVDRKLAHELSDLLWSLLVVSHAYGIDLRTEFLTTMDELERDLRARLAKTR